MSGTHAQRVGPLERTCEQRIAEVEKRLDQLARQTPAVTGLLSVPGIGLLTATALVAFVGEIRRFPSGRHSASYLGLVPTEHSSGEKRTLGAISKRGDTYLRMLLIHGARSVLWAARGKSQGDVLFDWALRLQNARGHSRAAAALGNKLAQIVWAVWREGSAFQARRLDKVA